MKKTDAEHVVPLSDPAVWRRGHRASTSSCEMTSNLFATMVAKFLLVCSNSTANSIA